MILKKIKFKSLHVTDESLMCIMCTHMYTFQPKNLTAASSHLEHTFTGSSIYGERFDCLINLKQSIFISINIKNSTSSNIDLKYLLSVQQKFIRLFKILSQNKRKKKPLFRSEMLPITDFQLLSCTHFLIYNFLNRLLDLYIFFSIFLRGYAKFHDVTFIHQPLGRLRYFIFKAFPIVKLIFLKIVGTWIDLYFFLLDQIVLSWRKMNIKRNYFLTDS